MTHTLKKGTKCYCGEADIPGSVVKIFLGAQNTVRVQVLITNTRTAVLNGYNPGDTHTFLLNAVTPRTARKIRDYGAYTYEQYRWELD